MPDAKKLADHWYLEAPYVCCRRAAKAADCCLLNNAGNDPQSVLVDVPALKAQLHCSIASQHCLQQSIDQLEGILLPDLCVVKTAAAALSHLFVPQLRSLTEQVSSLDRLDLILANLVQQNLF